MNISLHRVKEVSIASARKNVVEETGRVFYAREIIISNDVETLSISLFGPDAEALELKEVINET
jgi:hypothetical protein